MAIRGIALAVMVLLITSCQPPEKSAIEQQWAEFAARFIEHGRVIDKDNGDISHSEGQGYAMLLAEAVGDKTRFDQLWQWTQNTLQRPDKLFSWRYQPCEKQNRQCISDPNNASDGDILIAWALLRAHQRWQGQHYINSARQIIQAINNKLLVNMQGVWLLLPGEQGFVEQGRYTINLSYWVFPALSAFAREFPYQPWGKLVENGHRLLQQARFGRYQLNPDWLDVTDDGVRLSEKFPPRYGFEACRIPLYLVWSGYQGSGLYQPYQHFWRDTPTPAWIDLQSGEIAEYAWPAGMQAIASLVAATESGAATNLPSPEQDTGYYSSVLILLSYLAREDYEQK